ncbi:K02A2.6-like, partial [Cordylochernes scorpioides]
MSNIPVPAPILINSQAAENWRFFKSQWDNYQVATELNKKDNNVIRATFLSLIGKDCFNVFLNLDLKEDENNSLPKIIEALNNHFTPQKNVIYERYIFNTSNQEENEGIDSYTNRLRGLASSCEYDILTEELIRDRIVLGIKDNRVRKKLLMEPKLNLSSAIDICRTAEVTEQQITKLTGQESEDVKWNKKYERKKEATKATNETFEDIINCRYCGSKHRKASCPAYGKICTWCNRKNHFSKKKRHYSNSAETSSWISNLVLVKKKNKLRVCLDPRDLNKVIKRPHFQIPTIDEILPSLNNAKIFTVIDAKDGFWQVKLDSQSSDLTTFWTPFGRYKWLRMPFGISAAPEEFQRRLHEVIEGVEVIADDILIVCQGDLMKTGDRNELNFEVYLNDDKSIYQEIENIKLIEFINISTATAEQIRQQNCKDQTRQVLVNLIRKGWPKSKYKVPREAMEYWKFRDELTEQDGIIYKGQKVIIPKTLRSELLNRVHASHHGVAASLAKARQAIFWPGMNQSIKEKVEKCKACLAYQPNQTKETLMCHETPILPWNKIGMDIFSVDTTQYLITVDYYSSFWELDILEHTTSESIIECCKKNFSRHGIPETLITDNGPQYISREFQKFLKTWKVVQITSSRIIVNQMARRKKIHVTKQPHNRKTLRSFLKTVNAYKEFIPDHARLRTPLVNLLKRDVMWVWDDECQKAFTNLKENLTTHPTLHLYQEGLPCQVYCNTSTFSITGVLKQVYPDGKTYTVQHFSRSLRSHERNYSDLELQCLAIVESVDNFRTCLMGRKFTIFSDHPALQWLKEIKAPSGRLFRWRLRLSRYEYEVRSINGAQQYETGVGTRIPFCGFLDAPLIQSQQSSPPGKSRVTMDPNKLRTVSRKGVLKTIVPSSLTTRLLKSVHTQHHHPNISKMTRLISSQYYWQNMTQDIAKQ